MTPERWQEVSRLYQSALAQPAGLRTAFLAGACRDDSALRREVESLLAQDPATVLVDQPVGAAAAAVLSPGAGGLAPGTMVGAYRVTGLLGAGGMGQVYRAHDSKLQRDVALKILPDAFVHEPDRLARFTREAQVLASLNHPYIGAIYGFEDSGPIHALVLELVEGPTLADRIAQGHVPIDEALAIARQIAEALEAAHEHGVVHRDLKPANVKVRDDGTVKVLDFGLAKLTRGDESSGSLPLGTQSPTVLSPAMTTVGVILGTAAYMSPEQAKGRAADKRSDVWAFGCVLYEMLAGRRAFEGDDVSETMAAVLKSAPDLTLLPPSTPAVLRRLIERCLEKDRSRRLGDVAGIKFGLADAALPSIAASTPMTSGPRWPLIALSAAVLLIALAAVAAWSLRSNPPAPAVTRFVHTLPEGQVFTDSFMPSVALSPDGTQMVYVSNQQLYLRSMSDPVARPIAGTQTNTNMGFPTFSPDGLSIAFWVRTGPPALRGSGVKGDIQRVPVVGGTPLTVAELESVPSGISWAVDSLVFGLPGVGIMRVLASGSTPEPIVRAKETEQLAHPQLLDGGRAVLFSLRSGAALAPVEDWDESEIVVQSLASGQRKVLGRGSAPRFAATGHVLFARRGVILAVPFNQSRLEITGSAVPVVEGVGRAVNAGPAGDVSLGAAHFAFSDTGTMTYVSGPVSGSFDERSLVLVDRLGTAEALAVPRGSYESPRAAPDGQQIAVGTTHAAAASISIYDLGGTSALRRLTFEGNNRFPVWSPDGRQVAYQSDRDKDLAIFQQRSDGTAPAERLTTPAQGASHIPVAWFLDGSRFLFVETRGNEHTLWWYSMVEKRTTRFGDVVSPNRIRASVSPDGRWVAYTITNGEQGGVFLQAFPPTGAVYEAAVPGRFPHWSYDGRQLLFSRIGQVWALDFAVSGAAVKLGNAVPLPRAVAGLLGPIFDYDVMPDGRFIAAAVASDASRPEIQIVLNWFEELKARTAAR